MTFFASSPHHHQASQYLGTIAVPRGEPMPWAIGKHGGADRLRAVCRMRTGIFQAEDERHNKPPAQHRLKTISDDRHRTAEELSFAFSVLLARALPRQQAALLFQELWDEANEAAVACATERAALTYVELLKDMDKRWRHMPALH
jgi:hypothetical protein